MAERRANVSVRVEEDAKVQAEAVLDVLGMSMSTAVNLFLRQVAMREGLPFDVKVVKKPLALGSLSESELNAALQEGYEAQQAGEVFTEEQIGAYFRETGRV